LPDSLLLLDGLTFAARLDSPSKQSTFHLLENPLALALESMRGRPTLRHLGIVNLKDVYLDESGGVEMYVSPDLSPDIRAHCPLGIYTRLPCFHRFILRIPSVYYPFLLWLQPPTLLPHRRGQRSGYELRSVIAVSVSSINLIPHVSNTHILLRWPRNDRDRHFRAASRVIRPNNKDYPPLRGENNPKTIRTADCTT
jgi:hypothetical protein